MKVINKKTRKVENVADGHARNYLFPNGLAVPATPEAIAALEKELAAEAQQSDERHTQQQALATSLQELSVVVSGPANEDGTLFGGVSESAILDSVKSQGVDIQEEWISIPTPIKVVGPATVVVSFPDGPRVELTVDIQPA